jgi:hypothetical protein
MDSTVALFVGLGVFAIVVIAIGRVSWRQSFGVIP